ALQWRGVRWGLGATAGQVLLNVVFLADQARLMIDAVGRTLTRLYVTRRHLLEWETAAVTERRLGTDFRSAWLNVRTPSISAALATLLVLTIRPASLPAAAAILLAWLAAPLVAFWVSRPTRTRELQLTADERAYLRRLARKTWAFFETFVT